jgi:hypothetical protein
MFVLSGCAPVALQDAMQHPDNTCVGVLVVVAAVDASDCTPYYPDEIREIALMNNDRLVLHLFID